MHDSASSPATPFRQLLEDYLQRLPGSDAVALVDGEGEAVDQAGNADDFDVRIFAATLAIVAESARGQWSAGWTHLAIGFARESYHWSNLPMHTASFPDASARRLASPPRAQMQWSQPQFVERLVGRCRAKSGIRLRSSTTVPAPQAI
jgi:hypothetical protein